MIKSTSLSLSLFCAFAATAQITITSADMPNANDSLYVSNAATIGTHDPAETGAGFNWDYSDLKPVSQMPQKFDAPAKFPSIYKLLFNQFNTSYGKNNPLVISTNIPGIKIDAAYDFFKESGTSLNQIGVGYMINGTPLPFAYKHPDVIYRFPMNFLNRDSCDFDFGLALPGYGYYGQSGHRQNSVDGWGELKTPLRTYSTLRILSIVDITDTLYIEQDSSGFGFPIKRPTRYEYKWFTAGSKIPVLQVDVMVVNNQQVATATFIDTLRKDVIHIGIDENGNQPLSLQVYPNPAQDQFNLHYDLPSRSPVTITIHDMTGREVIQVTKENQMAGIHEQQVNTSTLSSGIYFLLLRSGDHTVVEKLSIAH